LTGLVLFDYFECTQGKFLAVGVGSNIGNVEDGIECINGLNLIIDPDGRIQLQDALLLLFVAVMEKH
jgi:hypothetical protein